ncbi:MAG: MFS transporter [Planctomycetota bacterium]|jgi:nucleoside transporter
MPTGVRIKLSVMMFLQFMLVAVFWIQLAPYLGNLGSMKNWQLALILSAMPIGCLFSPIVGMIADRYFAGQKVLFAMNAIGAILLFVAAFQTNPTTLFLLLLLFMICYMPSWGLTSAISMANSPPELFPQIRVFGSLGWVASAIPSLVALYGFGVKIDSVVVGGMNIPILIGGIASVVAALLALTVPDTPPPAKGKPLSVVDALGLRTVFLMKDIKFAFFIVISLLVMIPFTIHWSYLGTFLEDKGFSLIAGTSHIGQGLEIIFMLFVPLAVARMGVKWAMSVGLVALLVRYLAYLGSGVLDQTWLMYVAIGVHGLIYGFFFVGGQVYINKKAPKEMRAQAQGFIFLVTFGLGLLIGNFFNGELIGYNTTEKVAAIELPAEKKELMIELEGDYNTPDGMASDGQGNILVSMPNFNDPSKPARIVKIDGSDKLSDWFVLPPHPETKYACPLGIAFASDGNLYWADCQDLGVGVAGSLDSVPDRTEFAGKNVSRLCRVVVEDGKPVRSEVVVNGFFVSNAVACWEDCVYVTETSLGIKRAEGGPHHSGVYRFKLSELDAANPITLKTGGEDPHLITRFETKGAWPVGANGMGFGPKGELYVCNFGDAQLQEYSTDGKFKRVVAEGDPMKSTDGLMVDMGTGEVYIADFLGSAIHKVAPATGKVTTIQADPDDNDGSANRLDKCSECRKRGNKLYVANIDLPFDGNKPDKPNSIAVVQLKLYGWNVIWTVTSVISAALLALFFLFFWDKPGEADEAVKEEVAEKAESA